jgi:UDP-hydrolysing UDP-N-acetyl-D-glucosamine 2-epimerase
MGEEAWRVVVCGALSLENLEGMALPSRSELERSLGISFSLAPLIVTHHPATADPGGVEGEALVAVLRELDRPIVITLPNADAGSQKLRACLSAFAAGRPNVRLVENLGTAAYFGLMTHAAAMLGNSSSGLIEAPAFRLPVVNIGPRQDGRVRAANVLDVAADPNAIRQALQRAIDPDFRASLAHMENPFRAAGSASSIIADRFTEVELDQALMVKRFNDLAAR